MHLLQQQDQLKYLGHSLEPSLLEKVESLFTPTTQIEAKPDEYVVDPEKAALAPLDDNPIVVRLFHAAIPGGDTPI